MPFAIGWHTDRKLIGCTAIHNNMVMVTENIKDFKNLKNIKLENWFVREKK